ncbi:hypothetical protein BpHYR1_037142 [Brachionus plicatilis]|uniref:Uncharacterized protein n=1 Tax=Brachionus plicatilis TaxID=10195 RepID=A0A3M7T2J7_BRAPC|nr:hypothetical protein BpHYR1_037142 [Brachionus plicatilis]
MLGLESESDSSFIKRINTLIETKKIKPDHYPKLTKSRATLFKLQRYAATKNAAVNVKILCPIFFL